MQKYEILTIFNAALTDEEKDKIVEKYTSMMSKNDSKLHVVNKWGIKKLAYPINYKNDGFYVLFEFETDSKTLSEITYLMRIDENVMRHMCIKK